LGIFIIEDFIIEDVALEQFEDIVRSGMILLLLPML